jgi:hypothetical protein
MGMREIQRSKNPWTSAGPNRSQIACRRAGRSQEAKPFDSSVKVTLARVACRFAHSWPLSQILVG